MTTWFITGTDTDIGKTVVGTAMARGAHPAPVIALKPIETGVDGRPADADALAAACGRPDLADVHGFVRMRAPLAPWAANMGGEPAIDFDEVVEAIRVQLLPGCEHIIEGAGGLLVPLDDQRVIADLAREVDATVLIVAAEKLGVISHVLTAYECAWARGLEIGGIVLSRHKRRHASWKTNKQVIEGYVDCPVVHFPKVKDDAALAAAGAELYQALNRTPGSP